MSATATAKAPLVLEGKTIQCLDDAGPEGMEDIIGCGSTNLQGPDNEGIIDCLDCGIWFDVAEALSYSDRQAAQNTK